MPIKACIEIKIISKKSLKILENGLLEKSYAFIGLRHYILIVARRNNNVIDFRE